MRCFRGATESVSRECSGIKSGQEEDTGQYSDRNKGQDNLLRETGLCMMVEDERHDGIN